MLALSLHDYDRAGQIQRRDTSNGKEQNAGSDFRKVRPLAVFGGTVADINAPSDWREKDSDERCNAQDGADHGKLSPMASLLVANNREMVEFLELTLLGTIVFCIGFAITAGL